MATLFDRCWSTCSTNGTGQFVLTGAVPGFRAFSPAVPDSTLVSYVAFESSDNAWEIGTGVTSASGTNLTRNVTESSSGNALVFFNGGATVALTALAADILNPANNLSDVPNAATARTNLGVVSNILPTYVSGIILSPTSAPSGNGSLWQDQTQQTLAYNVSGISSFQSGVLYSITSPVSITTTGTQSMLGSSGVGTKILPARFFVPGRTIRISIAGQISVNNNTAVTINITYGGATIATNAAAAANATLLNFGFIGQYYITCQTSGVSGILNCNGDRKSVV